MRYNLGLMDQYPIEASGSIIENNPMFRVVLKEEVDPILLEDSIYKALKFHPLFETQVEFDKDYYLLSNNRPVRILKISEDKRPKHFGKFTNGYPWQVCYYDKTITFEWLHGVSDGVGAFAFLKHVLDAYCGSKMPEIQRRFQLAPGLEPFFDKKQKGINYEIDPQGFNVKDLPVYNRGYKTDCHVLKAKTEEIIKVSKDNESSIAPVLAILLSKAVRGHINKKARNKNVACNIVMDLRRPLNYETMHNCVEYKRITYMDKHEDMSFKDVAMEYKKKLDNARIPENVVRAITERVSEFEMFHIIKTKKLRKLVLKNVAKFIKDTDCNLVTTYLGKQEFSQEIYDKVEDIQFRVWHDFGECIMACMDYNGTFTINICENYIEKGIVEDFIKLSRAEGINWDYVDVTQFEQATFVEEN